MPTLSETYRSHPAHLDFTSLHNKLPDTHAWPRIHDRHPPVDDEEPVPLIDLRSPDVLPQISHACHSWGVFQVTGHGVPLRLLEQAESECHRLFSLPAEQKLKASRPPDGISGYGVARISTFFSKLMWSEGFTIAGSPVEHAKKLWPRDYARFCDVMEECKEEMRKLASRLTALVYSSLGLPGEEDVEEEPPGISEFSAVLQLNSYPVCPDPDRAMGLAEHTDSSLLTILHQSSTSGLQVLHDRGPSSTSLWVTVPPIPGALVVNVGDLFQILSNGRYRSVLHRAVVNRTRHRLSVAYIYGPPVHVEIAPLKRLLGPGEGPAYRAVTWPEYLGVKAEHFDKALKLIRVARDV